MPMPLSCYNTFKLGTNSVFRRIDASNTLRVLLAIAVLAFPLKGMAQGARPALDATIVNRGVVQLETGDFGSSSARVVEEIAGIVDDGATRRLLPVLGKGPLQSLADLRYLRGVDLAIVQLDALEYARAQRVPPGIDSLSLVAKLFNHEFHLLARSDIKTIADFTNKTINVDQRGSGTAFTAARVFDILKIPVTVAHDSSEVALHRLRKGEIAGLALVAPKPAPIVQLLRAEEGLHLLSIPLTPMIVTAYVPTRVTDRDYKDLVAPDQPIDTIAVANVLLAADLRMIPDRFRNVANVVDAFFTGFQKLLEPGHHPKWQEVNIAAAIPGLPRYQPAEQWLQRNMAVASAPNPEALKILFSRFVDERRSASGGAPMSGEEKDLLFQQFRNWQRGQQR
jgi:TRAP-type uncharacterized transport system substrate-binding protein